MSDGLDDPGEYRGQAAGTSRLRARQRRDRMGSALDPAHDVRGRAQKTRPRKVTFAEGMRIRGASFPDARHASRKSKSEKPAVPHPRHAAPFYLTRGPSFLCSAAKF